MRKIGNVLAVVAALVLALPASAQVSLDLKAGYALPSGDAAGFTAGATSWGKMSNTWSGAIPIEVAARYRFSPGFSAGVYYQYAPAMVAARFCTSVMTCSGYDTRVGVEAVYGFLPERTFNPWVSLGTGWEWTRYAISTPDGQTASMTYSGWEYFNVQAGLDWNISRMFAFGPWIGYFGGSYTSGTGENNGNPTSGTIPSSARTFHGWLQFGLKGTVNL